jgi:hypothetical protein
MRQSKAMHDFDELNFRNRLLQFLVYPRPSEDAIEVLYSRYESRDPIEVIAVAYNQGFYAGKESNGRDKTL